MKKYAYGAAMAVVLHVGVALACRPSTALPGELPLDAATSIPVRGDGADTVAPTKVVIDDVEVKLNAGACPNIDVLVLHVTASDDQTGAASLRYAASFGATAEEAAAAGPALLFDASSATHVSIPLLGNAARFAGSPRCFTLVAVDDAANVGPKSEATCVDTTKPTGCAAAPVSLLPLGVLLARRRRRAT